MEPDRPYWSARSALSVKTFAPSAERRANSERRILDERKFGMARHATTVQFPRGNQSEAPAQTFAHHQAEFGQYYPLTELSLLLN